MPPTLVPNGSGLHEPIYAVTLDLETAKLAADLPGGWPAFSEEKVVSPLWFYGVRSQVVPTYSTNTISLIVLPSSSTVAFYSLSTERNSTSPPGGRPRQETFHSIPP